MKAVFLDRDGVINKLVYHREQGIIDSPMTPDQFVLNDGVAEAIYDLQDAGYLAVVVSNQPGIAKGKMYPNGLEEIRLKMRDELALRGVRLDGEYYCPHHPEAEVKSLRVKCGCRKPEAGLLLQASKELDIDLYESWMVGDGLTDVLAGKKAGVRTILLGQEKCDNCRLMDEMDARPDYICKSLDAVVDVILGDNSEGT